jgi:hypothetical protein
MRKYLLLLAAAAFIAAPRVAHAGYTATTTTDTALTPDANGDNIANVGETFTVLNGGFNAYTADGPTDPQLNNSDIAQYHYDLNGTATSVSGLNVTYTGNYRIYYNALSPDVSIGNFTINALFDANTGVAALNGTLSETSAPFGPPFQDLGAYPLVTYTGTYTPVVFGAGLQNTGTVQGVIRAQGAASPEPGSMALLATGLLPFAGMLRRRRK